MGQEGDQAYKEWTTGSRGMCRGSNELQRFQSKGRGEGGSWFNGSGTVQTKPHGIGKGPGMSLKRDDMGRGPRTELNPI